jgi:diketogulonate reductase-like aldo/keto reductase
MASSAPVTKLNNGVDHPLLGYGTYKVGVVPASASAGGAVTRTTKEVLDDALAVGYRMFDCAQFYANEKGVGEAFAASSVPREDLFIVSKVWNDTIYEGNHVALPPLSHPAGCCTERIAVGVGRRRWW